MRFYRLAVRALLLALALTSSARAEPDFQIFRRCNFSRLVVPFGRQIELHDLRMVWGRRDLVSVAERFIRHGVMMGDPKLADDFIAEVERLVAQNPPLTSPNIYAALRQFLDRRRNAFNLAFNSDDRSRIRNRINQVKSLVKTPPKSILDIGAGDGQIVTALGSEFGLTRDKIFATEVADYQGASPATWLKYEPNGSIPLKGNSVDLATIFMVLHHTDDPGAIVEEVHRVLRPGGILIVRETDAVTVKDKLFNRTMDTLFYEVFSDVPGVPLPHNYKSRDKWRELFEEKGFEVVEERKNEPQNPFTPVFFVLRKK